MKRKGRRYRAPEPQQPLLVERPDLFPVYVYIPGPSQRERQLRGLAFFEDLKRAGLTVVIGDMATDGGTIDIPVRPPWTIIYATVATVDKTEMVANLRSYEDGCPTPVVYIVDCHFPITSSPDINVGSDLTANVLFLDAIPTMLDNLALADAVTVPNPDWATDLLAAYPDLPVFVLPDLEHDDPASMTAFGMRFSEIVLTACNQRMAVIREHPGGQ